MSPFAPSCSASPHIDGQRCSKVEDASARVSRERFDLEYFSVSRGTKRSQVPCSRRQAKEERRRGHVTGARESPEWKESEARQSRRAGIEKQNKKNVGRLLEKKARGLLRYGKGGGEVGAGVQTTGTRKAINECAAGA